MIKKIESFIHSDKVYNKCTDEEKREIDDAIQFVEKRLLRLQQQYNNMKEKEEKNYRNIPWR